MGKQVIRGNVPSKSNGYRIITINGHASLAKTKAMKDYENNFYIQCNQYRNANIEGYFELYMDVYYPTQKSDLDNSAKIVLDILQRKVKAIKNDNKCVLMLLRKFKDANNPRIEFELKQDANNKINNWTDCLERANRDIKKQSDYITDLVEGIKEEKEYISHLKNQLEQSKTN